MRSTSISIMAGLSMSIIGLYCYTMQPIDTAYSLETYDATHAVIGHKEALYGKLSYDMG